MSKAPRVFVATECRNLDLNAVNEYGTLTTVLDGNGGCSPFDAMEVERLAMRGLDDFDPARDFFVIAGPAIVVAQVFALAVQRFGRVRTLLFSATSNQYRMREVGCPFAG